MLICKKTGSMRHQRSAVRAICHSCHNSPQATSANASILVRIPAFQQACEEMLTLISFLLSGVRGPFPTIATVCIPDGQV